MSSVAPAPPPLKRPASRQIDVTSIQRRPRAVVILYGWLGAEYSILKRYAQIYEERGCCTVCATAPPLALLAGSRSYLREIAITSCREASMLIRKGEMTEMGMGRIPLVVHSFSNGGAFLVNEIVDIVGEHEEIASTDGGDEGGHERGTSTLPQAPSWLSKSQRNVMSPPALGGEGAAGTYSDKDDSSTSSSQSFETANEGVPSVDKCAGMSFASFQTAAEDDNARDLPKVGSYSYDQPSLSSVSPRARTNSWGSKRKCPRVKRTDSERKVVSMKEAKRPNYNSEERAYKQDMALIASRLRSGSLIFDSGPCFVTLSSGLQAARHGVRNPLLRVCSSLALIGGYTISTLVCSRVGIFGKFWENMQNNTLTERQAYIYSDSDAVCDGKKLRELISHRKAMGNEISVLKFTDSPHVLHMRYHKQEYESFVEKQLDAIAAKVMEDEGELARALQK